MFIEYSSYVQARSPAGGSREDRDASLLKCCPPAPPRSVCRRLLVPGQWSRLSARQLLPREHLLLPGLNRSSPKMSASA